MKRKKHRCDLCAYQNECSPDDCVEGEYFYPIDNTDTAQFKTVSKEQRRAGQDWYFGSRKKPKTNDELLNKLERDRRFWSDPLNAN